MKYKIKKFGDLKPGDKIIGSNGEEVTVTRVYDKHIPERMYELTMENGEIIKASGTHLWYTETNTDLAIREDYMKQAEDYFNNNSLPQRLEEDIHFPLEELAKRFIQSETHRYIPFLVKASESLGHSSVQPHAVVEGFDVNGEFIDYEEIKLYSHNDMIEFLERMKLATKGKAYFYFGKVRSTDEVMALYNHGYEVNIPMRNELEMMR